MRPVSSRLRAAAAFRLAWHSACHAARSASHTAPSRGTGPLAREIALLAEHGLGPAAALQAATTTAYQFLGEPCDQTGQPATLVTYLDDPRDDLAILSSPAAIIIDGIRVR